MKKNRSIDIYDTTLRDGSQSEDISFSLEDKLRITEKLDDLGVHYVEGGWPGSNPKDAEYFKKVKKLTLSNAVVAAFGSMHRPRHRVEDDYNIKTLLESGAQVLTIVGKTWDFHVRELFKIPIEENLEIIHASVTYLKERIAWERRSSRMEITSCGRLSTPRTSWSKALTTIPPGREHRPMKR